MTQSKQTLSVTPGTLAGAGINPAGNDGNDTDHRYSKANWCTSCRVYWSANRADYSGRPKSNLVTRWSAEWRRRGGLRRCTTSSKVRLSIRAIVLGRASKQFQPDNRHQILYKQDVMTEDVFLGMSGKDPSSAHCDAIVIRVDFPNHKMKDIELDVTKHKLTAQSSKL